MNVSAGYTPDKITHPPPQNVGGKGQVMDYDPGLGDPTAQGIVPADPAAPAVCYPITAGVIYGWNKTTKAWGATA